MHNLTFDSLIWYPLWGALKLSLHLMCFIVPLLVIFELIGALPFWRKFQGLEDGSGRKGKIGFSPYTFIPLFTGIFLGIIYGAGVIIRISKEKALDRADLWLLGLFLATCHAVVEDTLIFVVVGGMGRWIVIPRILLACFLSALLILVVRCGKTKQISP